MRVLGPDNPDTLVTRASLGIWLAQSGRIEQALEELRPVFNDQLRVLGPDDPATDMTRALIAGLQAMDADS
jgi:hypothetical protein